MVDMVHMDYGLHGPKSDQNLNHDQRKTQVYQSFFHGQVKSQYTSFSSLCGIMSNTLNSHLVESSDDSEYYYDVFFLQKEEELYNCVQKTHNVRLTIK